MNQEAKDKERKIKASGSMALGSGTGVEELLLQIQTLTIDRSKEEELKNSVQLQKVLVSFIYLWIICRYKCQAKWLHCEDARYWSLVTLHIVQK